VTDHLGEAEYRQSVQIREEPDPRGGHPTAAQTEQPHTRQPSSKLEGELGSVQITGLFACRQKDGSARQTGRGMP
jgi:hypothetical protein